jgi:S1-C subfamily serine protease
MVGKSGVIRFSISKPKLPGLRIIAPAGYTHLTQRSIALGSAYQPEEKLDASDWNGTVHFDGSIQNDLTRQLRALHELGEVLDHETLQRQLRRKSCRLELREPPDGELSPAEIYRQRKNTVVVIGHLFQDGRHIHGTGVVLDASGVIATAYHVIDKPSTVIARGVMTADGRLYAIREVLAANKTHDVALVRIDASDLEPAPLSHGDPEGTPVTVIAHPGSNFYSLTQGYISRYWAATSFGHLGVRMSITAQFADGASGGPVFNSRGAVTGLVSSTEALGYQMVRRDGPPARAIRKLIQPPSPDSPVGVEQEERPTFEK